MKFFPDHPHSSFLLHVSKPGRYAGAEYGCATVPKNPRIKLVLAFPDVYEIGCSNLGLIILYRLVSSMPWVHVERAFAPWKDYARELRQHRADLVSYESALPLKSFDIVGFSLQHELLYTNVLLMLDLAGIPLKSAHRKDHEPLIIAGGPSTSNPEPLAEFIDVFALGDGENLLPEILERAAEAKAENKSRNDLLEDLARLRGIYVPCFYDRGPGRGVRKVVSGVGHGKSAPLPVKYSRFREFAASAIYDPPVAALEPVFDRYQLEISRGCCGGCRFCHAGSVYRPLRHRPPGRMLKSAVEGLLRTGHSALSLSSLSPADYPCLEPVVQGFENFIRKRRILLSVSSLRSYGVSESVLKTIASVKATGITLAPEAGTQRLRNIIGKRVTDEDLMGSIELLSRLDWQRVKLYFMIGLPGEEEQDLEGIVETIRRCLKLSAGGRKRKMEISAAISNFVPKPFTAFQWAGMANLDELASKRRTIRKMAGRLRAKIDFHNAGQSVFESVLARGGGELGNVLLAGHTLGCCMDSWTDQFNFELWKQAFENCNLSMDRYLEKIPQDAPLPWDHIRSPVSKKYLAGELEKARHGKTSDACRSAGGGDLCHNCGVGCEKEGTVVPDGGDMLEFSRWLSRKEEELEKQSDAYFGRPLNKNERLQLELRFKRFGRMIYAGHQDMVRILRHILRRANIPLEFSSGFTPRPIINFRGALPLGVIGLNEEVYVEVGRTPLRLDGILQNLNRCSHPGIEFVDIGAADRKKVKEIIKKLPRAQWFALFPESVDRQKLICAANDFNGQTTIMMNRQRHAPAKGKAAPSFTAIDLKRMIKCACVSGEEGFPEIKDITDHQKAICFDTHPDDGHIIRRDDINHILEKQGLFASIHIRRLV